MPEYNGDDRREKKEAWHLDKKVPISLIAFGLAQFAMAILAYAQLAKDIELLKQDSVALHAIDATQANSLKDAMRLMQDQFTRMDAKLDRLIERQSK